LKPWYHDLLERYSLQMKLVVLQQPSSFQSPGTSALIGFRIISRQSSPPELESLGSGACPGVLNDPEG
jgi:hypothetical protein